MLRSECSQIVPTAILRWRGRGRRARLEQFAKQLGVSERVHFAGELAPERVGDFLASFDVFAFPSERETFGMAAVEAAGACIPTVVTDLSGLREVLSVDGEPAALFVDAADPHEQ